ncbi:hypothetical protein FNV43_RR00646 [Rhamnella rubrinervis]|uniref:Uncharacterized protein n=1 Tax=Rhamnella rubrinervis TaxID=2594499 RepID=A0A8K0HPZ3_9ROSA|nr:hypothetical protein FNV43_RR00646 [Rhamnella rubrinervis]
MRMGPPRIEARHYISIYQLHPLSDDQILLTFAKLISTFCKNAPKRTFSIYQDVYEEIEQPMTKEGRSYSYTMLKKKLMDDGLTISVECYMNKHGVSEEEVCDELRSKLWMRKDINEECVEPRDVPMALLMHHQPCKGNGRFYKDGDGYTHAAGPMKTFISSLLVHPIPI